MPLPFVALAAGALFLPRLGAVMLDKGGALVQEHWPATREALGGILDMIPGGAMLQAQADKAAAAKAAPAVKHAKAAQHKAEAAQHRAEKTATQLRAELTVAKRKLTDTQRLLTQERDLASRRTGDARRWKGELDACRAQLRNINAYGSFADIANPSNPNAPIPQGAEELFTQVTEGLTDPSMPWPDASIYQNFLPAAENVAANVLDTFNMFNPFQRPLDFADMGGGL